MDEAEISQLDREIAALFAETETPEQARQRQLNTARCQRWRERHRDDWNAYAREWRQKSGYNAYHREWRRRRREMAAEGVARHGL